MLVQEHLRPTRVLRSFEKLHFFVWKPYKQYPARAGVPCACADGSGCRDHTPHSNYVYVCNGDVLALLERCYWTTDRYDKQQATDLASRFARGSVATANACLAGAARRFRADRSTIDYMGNI